MKVELLFYTLSGQKESACKAGIDLRVSIVHMGQHYDPNMSEIFFRELGMPAPDRHLDLGCEEAGIWVAFVEAVLRSFDTGMPKEINQKLTDSISDLLFVTGERPRRSCRDEGRSVRSRRRADRRHPIAAGNPGSGTLM